MGVGLYVIPPTAEPAMPPMWRRGPGPTFDRRKGATRRGHPREREQVLDSAFRSLGETVVRHRRKVLTLWAAFLLVGAIFAPQLHKVFMREFTTGSAGEAQRAADIVDAEFPGGGAFQEQLPLSSHLVHGGRSGVPRGCGEAHRELAAMLRGQGPGHPPLRQE